MWHHDLSTVHGSGPMDCVRSVLYTPYSILRPHSALRPLSTARCRPPGCTIRPLGTLRLCAARRSTALYEHVPPPRTGGQGTGEPDTGATGCHPRRGER